MVLWCSRFPLKLVVVAAFDFECKSKLESGVLRIKYSPSMEILHTLKRVPMEENFDCFDASSDNRGKRFATKGHLEAFSKAWCSATT